MGDLIKALGDYLDLGKRVVNTVPGLVMAFALVLLLSSPPDYFQSQFLLQKRDGARSELSKARAELGSLTQAKAIAAGGKAYASDQLGRAKECRSAQPPKGCPDEPVDLQPLFVQEAEKIGQVSVLQNQIDAKTAELNSRQTELNSWNTRVWSSEDFQKFMNSGLTGWLLFGLLGMAIGTVLDPLNKALFLQWLPGLAGDKGLSGGPGRLPSIVHPPKDKYAPDVDKPPQYYVGSGVVTQPEYDGLVSDYYRWSEISIGMILPVLVLAVGAIQWWRRGHGDLPPVWLWIAIFGTALTIAVCLFIVGLRRYRDFQLQVNMFVAGRLDQRKQQLEAQKTKVDLTALNQLVFEAKHLIEKIHPRRKIQ